MNREELDKILELHRKWLNNEPGGVRADLRWAKLIEADLRWADLRVEECGRLEPVPAPEKEATAP